MINSLKKETLLDIKDILINVGVKENMRIADLGCGRRGSFSLQAAKLVKKNGLIFAVDILKPALKNIRSKAEMFNISNIKTIWANLEVYKSTNIADNEVDIVFLSNTLFQSEKHEIVIKEANRILKDQGKVLIIEWKKIKSPIGPPMEKRIDQEKIKTLFEKLDLKLVNEFEAGPYHYGLVYKK